ncbi:hypothetical protein K8O92_21240 [Nocardia asteroides]|nr:hypothetical protein K8O92_21240 [Nocardia asteroides]
MPVYAVVTSATLETEYPDEGLAPTGNRRAALRRHRRSLGDHRRGRISACDPIWFLWTDDVFRLTSFAGRPHLNRMHAKPRVGLVVDTEDALRRDGQRPNPQLRVIGNAALTPDVDGTWTARCSGPFLKRISGGFRLS